MWVDEAKLEWTDKMEDRSKQITFFPSAATCIYNQMYANKYASEVSGKKSGTL